MNLDSTKDFLKNILENLHDQIKDSSTFNILLEKYSQMDDSKQIWLKRLGFLVLIAVSLALPCSFFIQSIVHSRDSEVKKQLIYSLLESDSYIPTKGMSANEFHSTLSKITQNLSSKLNQTVSSTSMTAPLNLPSLLRELKYSEKEVKVQKINIAEVMNIGRRLENIDPSVKLIRLKVEETEDNHFTAVYSLLHFLNPDQQTTKSIKPLPTRRKRKLRKKN